MHFPDPKPGDYLTAEMLQVLYEALKRGVAVVPPLYLTATGAIGLGEDPGIWIKITGAQSGGAFPWQEVLPQAGGTWVNGPRSGTTTVDPAREINANTATLTGKYVRAWRDRTSAGILFHYSACS